MYLLFLDRHFKSVLFTNLLAQLFFFPSPRLLITMDNDADDDSGIIDPASGETDDTHERVCGRLSEVPIGGGFYTRAQIRACFDVSRAGSGRYARTLDTPRWTPIIGGVLSARRS